MEVKLNNPLQVYNKESGSFEAQETVKVFYTGKKGLQALKRLQDVIFKTFQETASSSTNAQEESKKDANVTVNEVLMMLDMTGSSERVFNAVTDSLKHFAQVGGQPLNEELQNQMDADDLEELYQEVLKGFLLPKIILKMNSMSK